jgi:hypothetical protein
VVAGIGGELRSACIGHAPSELAKNGGANTGGGSEHGHLRFSVPQDWQWLPIIVMLSWLSDTHVAHTVNFEQGVQTAFVSFTCLIRADTRNLRKRLKWWDLLLAQLAKCTASERPGRLG